MIRLESLPDFYRIQQGYDQMWESGSLEVLSNQVDADPIPDSNKGRWGVSIIARIKVPALEPLIESARNLCGEKHTFYHPDNQHITVRWCEFFRPEIPPLDAAIKTYQSALAEAVMGYKPLEVVLCGLNANRTGIIMQGYPLTPELQTLRNDLHTRLLTAGTEAELNRRGAHTSLVVFGGPIKDTVGLHGWVSENRNTHFEAVRIHHLQLVRYHRTQFDVKPICLFEVKLGG